jgi:hypothetical protein
LGRKVFNTPLSRDIREGVLRGILRGKKAPKVDKQQVNKRED